MQKRTFSHFEGDPMLTLWAYAAVTVWCNGREVCSIEEPVYKPIMKREFTVELEEGRNELYIRLQTLGFEILAFFRD